jgi:hypothetical protein
MNQRTLTVGETAILTLIQQGYGPQNAADKVLFTNRNEAVIFGRNLMARRR